MCLILGCVSSATQHYNYKGAPMLSVTLFEHSSFHHNRSRHPIHMICFPLTQHLIFYYATCVSVASIIFKSPHHQKEAEVDHAME